MSDVDAPLSASPADYAGLFLVAMATLMLEILLTRIFSVTLWYHLAFIAVSIAMFGMSLGSVVVYLFAPWFSPARAWMQLAAASALFAVSAVASVAIHMRTAIDPTALTSALVDLSKAYGLIAVPFFFSGIAVSIALTRFPKQVSRLYAADLAGAALGCVALIAVLDRVGGPWTVSVVAAVAFAGALCFAWGSADAGFLSFVGSAFRRIVQGPAAAFARHARFGEPRRSLRRRREAGPHVERDSLTGSFGRTTERDKAQWRPRLWMTGAIVATGVAMIAVMSSKAGRLEIKYAKGTTWRQPFYEKWNSYSRVAVTSDAHEEPFGWGLSATYKPTFRVRQLHLNIDASAETVLTQFDGAFEYLDYLTYDITNIGLHLRQNGSVYVIGAGGGRDVLSALVFGHRRVVAVEMNRAILEAVNGVFGHVTGRLDRNPRVQFVNDEARSYLGRSPERFDFIQISLIDTWAATAAGAFVLSENTLYTTNAWNTFLNRLTDNGIVSISRWYQRPDPPHEVHRATVLATTALRELGVANTRPHLMIVLKQDKRPGEERTPGVATLLASRAPFSESDIDTIEAVAKRLDFDVILSPRAAPVPLFAELADAGRVDRAVADAPVDLSAPTDDRPFFFKMDSGLLRDLLTFVTILALVFLVVPVLIKAEAVAVARDPALSITFLAIGIGFMLVEISQMLRLTFLLGHPTFSLSVALFGMLLSSGLGSYSTRGLDPTHMETAVRRRVAGLIAVLILLGLVTDRVIDIGHTGPTPVRVGLALLLLAPAGYFMGMAFPLAMKMAAVRQESLTAWLWGINGAASVCASVLAVVIASNYGISAAWWSGVVCYVVAGALIAREARRMGRVKSAV